MFRFLCLSRPAASLNLGYPFTASNAPRTEILRRKEISATEKTQWILPSCAASHPHAKQASALPHGSGRTWYSWATVPKQKVHKHSPHSENRLSRSYCDSENCEETSIHSRGELRSQTWARIAQKRNFSGGAKAGGPRLDGGIVILSSPSPHSTFHNTFPHPLLL